MAQAGTEPACGYRETRASVLVFKLLNLILEIFVH